MFKEKADQLGYLKTKVPVIHAQADYYERFIKPTHFAKNSLPSVRHKDLNQNSSQILDFPTSPKAIGQRKTYLKMKDILNKNHDDKVRDYLRKMDGQSLEEIVNGGHVMSPRKTNELVMNSK